MRKLIPLALNVVTVVFTGCVVAPVETSEVGAGDVPVSPGLTPRAPVNTTGTETHSFFVGNSDGHLYVANNNSDGAYKWPEVQTVALNLSATAVSWGPNRIDVFAIEAPSNTLRHYATHDGGVTPYTDNWGSMPNHPFDPNALCDATSWGTGRLDVFCLGTAPGGVKAVIHTWWDNGWHGWERVGTPFGLTFTAYGVASASWGPGRLDIWLVDYRLSSSAPTLRHAYTNSSTGVGGWTWEEWGTNSFKSVPDATSVGVNRYDVVVQCLPDYYDPQGSQRLCAFRSNGSTRTLSKIGIINNDYFSTWKPGIVNMGGGRRRVSINSGNSYELVVDYSEAYGYEWFPSWWSRPLNVSGGTRRGSDVTSW